MSTDCYRWGALLAPLVSEATIQRLPDPPDRQGHTSPYHMCRASGLEWLRRSKPKMLSPSMGRPFPNRAAPGMPPAELGMLVMSLVFMSHLSGDDRSRHLMTLPMAQSPVMVPRNSSYTPGPLVLLFIAMFQFTGMFFLSFLPSGSAPTKYKACWYSLGQSFPDLSPVPLFSHSFSYGGRGGRGI